MKTGLVTFYHIHHYGALLQAVATERAVERCGSECETLDYYVNQDNALFRRPTGIGSAAADAHTALHYAALKRRYERFESFSRAHLRLTNRRYESLEELREADLPYDVILSGSDQIWNPTIFPDRRLDPVFFGAFSDRRKIAYAPSFGVPRLPEGMEEELRGYLAAFSHLSVREKQGQAILRQTLGREVPVVLDPTLLLTAEQWDAMAAAPAGYPEGGYLLCYCISPPAALAPYIRRLAEETGIPVVQLCGTRQKVHPKARCILDAGPAEFLHLFRNAAFVLTNSFHGTVFSVQFQKPFFLSVSPRELSDPESSRTFSLLSRLGLGDRIIGRGDTAALDAHQHLRHAACFRKEDLWRLRGAKYVQSDLGDTFRTVKKALESRTVLFSGTPCQVDGLYRYLGCRPENLITCDLVCHGVPSPAVWEDMAESIRRRRGKDLQAVRFRNKVSGWKNSHMTAVYEDGTVESKPLYATEYGRAFGRSLFLRPSCYRCAYANLNRPGDFTLGDLWGLGPDELPEQQERGVSLLLVNTPHASHIFDQLPLTRQVYPIERAVAGNPHLAAPAARPAERAAFFAAYALEPFEEVRRKFLKAPPLPVRLAGKVLSPEVKAKLREKLRP